MSISPETTVGPPIRQRTGYLKLASINGVKVLITNATFNQQNNFQYTRVAFVPVTGFKQKTVHARGVTEVDFNLTGDLSLEAASVFKQLVDPANRGTRFPIVIQQDLPGVNLNPCFTEDITISGAQNGIVTWSLSGKCLRLPIPAARLTQTEHQHPMPAWSSGRNLIQSWSLSHKVSLQANWRNNQVALPNYYRPGESDYSLSFTTLTKLQEHDRISISIADVLIIRALVLRRGFSTGDRNEPLSFQAEVTNVNFATFSAATLLGTAFAPAFTPAVRVITAPEVVGENEIQKIELTGDVTGGTYLLSFKDAVTTPIPFDAPATLVQSSLQALSTVPLSSVSVEDGDEGEWEVEFVGGLANSNVEKILTDGSLLTGPGNSQDVRVRTIQQGQHDPNQVLGWPDGV